MREDFVQPLLCALLNFVEVSSVPQAYIFWRPYRGFVNIVCIHGVPYPSDRWQIYDPLFSWGLLGIRHQHSGSVC
jgi:hypothetical protein